DKESAREAIRSWLHPSRPGYVRVNGLGTPWFESDLELAGRPGLVGIVLPKAETPEQIALVASHLGGDSRVLPLVETAVGVWNARELAQVPRVERLAFGSVDFQLDTGMSGHAEDLLYARSRLVLASRVASILSPLDGVTMALDDVDLLRED